MDLFMRSRANHLVSKSMNPRMKNSMSLCVGKRVYLRDRKIE